MKELWRERKKAIRGDRYLLHQIDFFRDSVIELLILPYMMDKSNSNSSIDNLRTPTETSRRTLLHRLFEVPFHLHSFLRNDRNFADSQGSSSYPAIPLVWHLLVNRKGWMCCVNMHSKSLLHPVYVQIFMVLQAPILLLHDAVNALLLSDLLWSAILPSETTFFAELWWLLCCGYLT